MSDIRESLLKRQQKQKISDGVDTAFSVLILAACLLIVFARVFWFACVEIDGDSMYKTLEDGDYVLVNKLASFDRGDVIVFTTDEISGETKSYIKRVIAVGGDSIAIKNGKVYLKRSGEPDFSELKELYLIEGTETFCKGFLEEGEIMTVPENCVFVMGDNRAVSKDSRTFGVIHESKIDGVVSLRVIENKNGFWGRFYKYF